jgi:uncharacterized protein
MDQLAMELRAVDESERVVTGVVAPYDELTYLTPNPSGERILRGAFKKSIAQRGGKIPLCRAHDHSVKLGTSRRFTDEVTGLVGEFVVNRGELGDKLLEDLRNGYLDSMSVAMQPLVIGRAADGALEVKEARLHEVSMVAIPAYQGAAMLSVRNAQDLDELLAPFRNRPEVNLAPVPPIVHTRR